ncbi:hypothetical protein N657DRAFT_569327 [Parathielavia appendiculata]|uniref:Uncharacterized protein n=1 Tax=Parathielavia appendiculata TaxID=2587402 RepID=A0AAN6Z6C4_9PEZI|nr:hypothetical protein N657DRAFT_569327 [Parathielavia appendiculata]
MPPPHLHPRSRMTSSLFATTVLASFLVVALPHILPCPAPRRRAYYADDGGDSMSSSLSGSSRRVRRRRREEDGNDPGTTTVGGGGDGAEYENEIRRRVRGPQKRECPVPKPGGILGEWLRFHGGSSAPGKEGGEKTRPDR